MCGLEKNTQYKVYWSGVHWQRMGLHPDSQVTLVAKISASCPPVPNINMETEFGGNRKERLYYFCQAKWKHSQCLKNCAPHSQEQGEVFYPLEGLAFFFFFFPFFFSCKVSKWPQLASDNSATRSCVPEVIVP